MNNENDEEQEENAAEVLQKEEEPVVIREEITRIEVEQPSDNSAPNVIKQVVEIVQEEVKQPVEEENEESHKPVDCRTRNEMISDDERDKDYLTNGPNKVYIWGSGECDQFFSDESESRRPIEMEYFSRKNIKIAKIVCGSQHTLVLTKDGTVYSWGNSDDGCLGRETDNGSSPGMVPLQEKIDLVSAGEAHSLFANSKTGNMYFTGVIKSINGKFSPVITSPLLIEHHHIKRYGIQTILSGQNHCLVLSGSKIFSFGDYSMGQLGHLTKGFDDPEKCLTPTPIGLKSVNRIFTGANHSFAICRRNQVMTWGLNSLGQLGLPYYLDNPEDSDVNNQDPNRNPNVLQKPHLIGGLSGKNVKDIAGGEHHTLVLMNDGTLLGSGRNDECQLAELKKPPRNSYQECILKNQKVKVAGTNIYIEVTEDYMPNSFMKIPNVKPLQRILSRSHFNYGINTDDEGWMKIYTWGAGFNYVLGNGKENTQEIPFRISNEKFFKQNSPTDIALGHSHVVYYTGTSHEVEMDEDGECLLGKRSSRDVSENNGSNIKRVRN